MPRLFAAALLLALALPAASGAHAQDRVDLTDRSPIDKLAYGFGFEAAQGIQRDTAVFAFFDYDTFAEGFEAGLTGDSTRIAYLFGYELGSRLASNRDDALALDSETFLAAFREGLAHAEMQLSDQELKQAQSVVQDSIQMKTLRTSAATDSTARQRLALIRANARAADSLLAAAAQREGAERSASGLVVIEGTVGTGDVAGPEDTVLVRYTGTLADGTEFDASGETPARFSLGGVVDGFQEGIAGMREGGTRTLVIPPSLGYGLRGTPGGPIGPNAALTFEVELVEVLDAPGAAAQ